MPQYSLINDKMLSVRIQNEEVFAKRGSMIAYKGNVDFAPSSSGSEGMQGMAMRSVTGERMSLMIARGSGEVLYAFYGKHVTIVPLSGETFFAESDSLLAYDGRLRSGTVFLGNQGMGGLIRGAATGSGMFTTTLEGSGELAIVSDGDASALEVTPDRPIFADPQAYVGHRGHMQSELVTDVGWKTFVGQSSGESYQLKFTGQGIVYIQAAERGGNR
jgi:uncharacterized protein (AIM24 family)